MTFISNIPKYMDGFPFHIADTVAMLNLSLKRGKTVLCEMTQGFDLCLEHGIHPRFCTSKMIHPAMAMAEAGVSPNLIGHIYGVIRPYPIRVNNREGSSGPYAEAKEITWEDVRRRSGCPKDLSELTTTTKLPRRVFEFSHQRYDRFIGVCNPDFLCLQFANYIDWSCYGQDKQIPIRIYDWVHTHIPNQANRLAYIGTSEEDMIDTGIDPII